VESSGVQQSLSSISALSHALVFKTYKTRYCHGLWSGVASRPLANCFIYRIAVFGRVNCFLLPSVLLSERGVVMAFSPSVPSRPQADCFAFRRGRWYQQYLSSISPVSQQHLSSVSQQYLISISAVSQQYLTSISAVSH
jgi:hypothetical protein